ncbi:MAG: hypothetical protein ACO2PN_02615 [Pyrobaculum sp.]|jgi:hypothetical protein
MKRVLLLLFSSYAVLTALFVIASALLPILRERIAAGFAVGDVAIVVAVFLYGLFIYITGLLLIRASCKDRR